MIKLGIALVSNVTPRDERRQMKLVTVREAAETVFVTRQLLDHLLKTGRITKYPNAPKQKYKHFVDLDEVQEYMAADWKDKKRKSLPENLISRKEAAELLWVKTKQISYYVRHGYIKPHYVFGNDYHYLVDRDEVLAQARLIPERLAARAPRLREAALRQNQPKDERGKYISNK